MKRQQRSPDSNGCDMGFRLAIAKARNLAADSRLACLIRVWTHGARPAGCVYRDKSDP